MKDSPLSNRGFVVGAALLLLSAASFNGAVATLKLHLKKLPIEVEQKVHAIPGQTHTWNRVGEDRLDSEEIVEKLGTTNYLNRRYVRATPDAKGNPVAIDLHMAYYTGMVDTVPHVPDRCLTAAGWAIAGGPYFVQAKLDPEQWSIDREATAQFATPESPIYRARQSSGLYARLPRGSESIKLNTSVFTYPGKDTTMTAGYFFIANGGVSATAEGVRLLAFDLRSDYAYFLKVQFTSFSAKNADELAQLGGEFLQEMLPEIMQCVPDWIEVQRGNYPDDNPRKGLSGSTGGKN